MIRAIARPARRRFLVGFTSMLLGSPVWAAVDRGTAESLLRRSGLWEQLAGVAAEVRAGTLAGMAQGRRAPAREEIERAARAVDHAYSANRLRSSFVAAVVAGLEQAHVAPLRRWYDSHLGQAITRLEVAQSGQRPEALLERGVARLGSMSSSRRRLLEELVVAQRAAETLTELTIGSALAARQGAASFSSQPAGPSLRELKEALDSRRHDYMRRFSAWAVTVFAAMYSSVADADLEKYLAFLKSDAGEHYLQVTTHAFGRVMFDAAVELGGVLAASRSKLGT
jgi:hypothetical protein